MLKREMMGHLSAKTALHNTLSLIIHIPSSSKVAGNKTWLPTPIPNPLKAYTLCNETLLNKTITRAHNHPKAERKSKKTAKRRRGYRRDQNKLT